MNELTVESHGVQCQILANEAILQEIVNDQFTYHHIPDIKLVSSRNSDLQIVEDDSLKELVELKYPVCSFKNNLSSRDVITLAEYLLERKRQEELGLYSLSSATASKNGCAVTFFGGATHLGKTSSLLGLIDRYEYDFVSDEKTLIDLKNQKIVGGSRSIPLRKEIIKERLNTSSKQDFFVPSNDANCLDSKLFIYPHLDHGLENPISHRFKPLDFYWQLTRELGGVIRGSVRLVSNFSYPIESIDSTKLSKKRTKKTYEFTNKVPCYYFQGSIKQITEFVDNLMQ